MTDEPTIDLCSCDRFHLWYVEDHRWCRCGHDDGEHLDRRGSCVGEIEILRPLEPSEAR